MGISISVAEAILCAGILVAAAVVLAAFILAKQGKGSHAAPPWSGLESMPPLFELPQSEEGRPVEPSDIPVTPDTPLEIGSTVLAYEQQRWWRAEVMGFEPGDQVRLHFPGWDAKWDRTVSRDELQVDLHGPGKS